VQRALDATDPPPGAAYRALLAETLADHDLTIIRAYLQQQRAYGRDEFQAMVEAKTRRFAGVRPAHRPARICIAKR
jgi:putative transposase